MEESMMRELIFIQDNLIHLIPFDLWQKWAIINEEVCEYLERKNNNGI